MNPKHHCRLCGKCVCSSCSSLLQVEGLIKPCRICKVCGAVDERARSFRPAARVQEASHHWAAEAAPPLDGAAMRQTDARAAREAEALALAREALQRQKQLQEAQGPWSAEIAFAQAQAEWLRQRDEQREAGDGCCSDSSLVRSDDNLLYGEPAAPDRTSPRQQPRPQGAGELEAARADEDPAHPALDPYFSASGSELTGFPSCRRGEGCKKACVVQ